MSNISPEMSELELSTNKTLVSMTEKLSELEIELKSLNLLEIKFNVVSRQIDFHRGVIFGLKIVLENIKNNFTTED